MKTGFKQILFIALLAVILLSSCQKRYWYRSFVWGNGKNAIPANITINNSSPEYISKTFENEILLACQEQLLKKGYKVITKKTAFTFELNMKVGDFLVSSNNFRRSARNYTVQAILFECNLFQTKKDLHWKVWENNNDLYFFDQQKRDLRRSKSMVRHLIRSAK